MQISIDDELLARIDSDPEARTAGRSAFVRSAVRHYLIAKERREIESRLESAYRDQADALIDEIAELVGDQDWPSS